MNKLFSYDGFISRLINKLVDVILLSVLWIISSLPLFTIGAAFTALYHTVHTVIINDESSLWKEYWKAFRMNFKQATPVCLLLAVVYYILFTSLRAMFMLYSAAQVSAWTFLLTVIPMILITMWSVYLFPSIARFVNPTKRIMKNCFLIAVMNIIPSFLLTVILVASLLLLVLFPSVVLFLPTVSTYFVCIVTEKVFRKYMPDSNTNAMISKGNEL